MIVVKISCEIDLEILNEIFLNHTGDPVNELVL